MAIKDGGHAFPNITPDMNVDGGPGMTLRDYFAAKAMQAAICEPQWSNGSEYALLGKLAPELAREPAQQVARTAYVLADALLAEREKAVRS